MNSDLYIGSYHKSVPESVSTDWLLALNLLKKAVVIPLLCSPDGWLKPSCLLEHCGARSSWRVLIGTSDIEVVLMFKIILGSGTVLFTWEGL